MRPLMQAEPAFSVRVPSRSGAGEHRVFAVAGEHYCTCDGFRYRRHCRHIDHVYSELAQLRDGRAA